MEKAVSAEVERQSQLLIEGGKIKQENRGFDENTGKTVSQREKEEAHDYRYFSEPDIPPMVFEQNYFDELKKLLPQLPYQKQQKYLKLGLSHLEAAFLSAHSNAKVAELFESLSKRVTDKIKLAKMLINKPQTQNLDANKIIDMLQGVKDQITDKEQLDELVKSVIEANPLVVQDYKKGKTGSIEFLVGKIMQTTKGKVDASKVRELFKNML